MSNHRFRQIGLQLETLSGYHTEYPKKRIAPIQCEHLECRIVPANYLTTLTLTAMPSPAALGEQITLAALVKYSDFFSTFTLPTDSQIQFFEGTTLLGSSQTGTDGNATFRTTTLPTGTHNLRAEFSGSYYFGFFVDYFLPSQGTTSVTVKAPSAPAPAPTPGAAPAAPSAPATPSAPTPAPSSTPLFDYQPEVVPYTGPVGTQAVNANYYLKVAAEGTRAEDTPYGYFWPSGSGPVIQKGADALIPVVVKATNGGPTPTGTVTFRFRLNDGDQEVTARLVDASSLYGPGSAVAVSQFRNVPSGTTIITAFYSGDPAYAKWDRTIRVQGKNLTGQPEPPAEGPIVSASGASAGNTPANAWGYNSQGQIVHNVTPYEADFPGGIRVAIGDVNGDGHPELIVAPGPGRAPEIKIFDGITGQLIHSFMAFEETFRGGVFVTAGDMNGDGRAEIVVAPDKGGGPRVRVFNGTNLEQLADFLAIEDPNFRGGVRASIGDVNNDGIADLSVGAGFGGGPRIAIYDGLSFQAGQQPRKIRGDFFVFEDTLRDGVYVGNGDVNDDGFSELIVGGGPGGAPRVQALNGADLVQERINVISDFFAGDVNDRNGAQVSGLSGYSGLDFCILALAGGLGRPQVFGLDGNPLVNGQPFVDQVGIGSVSGLSASAYGTSNSSLANSLQNAQPQAASVSLPVGTSASTQLGDDQYKWRTYTGNFEATRVVTWWNSERNVDVTQQRKIQGSFRLTIQYKGSGNPTATSNESGWMWPRVSATVKQLGGPFPFKYSATEPAPDLTSSNLNSFAYRGDLDRLDNQPITMTLGDSEQVDYSHRALEMTFRIQPNWINVDIEENSYEKGKSYFTNKKVYNIKLTYGKPNDL